MREDQYSDSGNNESSEDDATYEEGNVVDQTPHQTTPQRPPQKAPQGTAARGTTQGASPPARRTPHPANAPLPTNPSPGEPTNPFKEGTKKFLVAQRLIAGAIDRGRLAKDIGVSNQTIYNVVADLRTHGYTLKIDVNSPKSTATSATPRATSTPRTTQQSPQGEIEGSSVGETTPQPNYSGEMQSGSKYYPGETTQVDESTPGRSRVAYRGPTVPRGRLRVAPLGRLLPELLPRRRCRVTQNTTLGRLPKRMKLPRVDLRGLPESLASPEKM